MPDKYQSDVEVPISAAPRILIMSSVRLLRDGLAQALASQGMSETMLATPFAPLDHLRSPVPDVVIMDVSNHLMLERMRELANGNPPLRVIAFGVEEIESEVLACAEAGAAGYMSRECTASEMVTTIESVCRDELLCSPRVAAVLFRRHAIRNELAVRDAGGGLTHREQEVLTLVDRGMSNKEISAQLHIGITTVKHHVHRILGKLHVRRRGAAAAQLRASAETHHDLR